MPAGRKYVGDDMIPSMKTSPFPGMDPYLESHWLDVHTSLVAYGRDTLNQLLPEDLAASSEERVAVESESPEDEVHALHPDVKILELSNADVASVAPSRDNVATAPIRLIAQFEPVTERFIRIVETGTDRLVTVIEFISPSNKRNPGLADFRGKRAELLDADVSFVEIDLVRSGSWRRLMRPHYCPPAYSTAYRVTVRKPTDPAAVLLYPISLRGALPSIVIPLRPRDPEIRLELQTLVDHAYAGGRYARRINYQKPPDPPLDLADQSWVREILQRES
jgi:hypothetical protein